MPRLGKLLALLALSLAPALFPATQVAAAPAGAPLASALAIDVTWEINRRDGTVAFFPARYLYTEICDATGTVCFGDSLDLLDANGQATLTTTEYTSGDVTLKLWSWAVVNGNDVLLHQAPPGLGANFQWLTPAFPPAPAKTAQIPFLMETDIPAYWLMDDLVESFLKVPGADQATVVFRGFWDSDFFNHGPFSKSFFCYESLGVCQDSFLYFFQQDIRADEVDGEVGKPNRVAIHESGHAVQYWMYGEDMPAPSEDYSPPGNCFPWNPATEITGEPDCAWQEGWADFWRLYALGTSTIHFVNGRQRDYENASPGSWDTGDEVPGRITGALWDIDDVVNDGSDSFAFGFDVIWDSLKNFAFAADGTFDNTFVEYWDTWRDRNPLFSPAELNQCAVTSIYQNTITYAADAWLPCAGAQVGFQKVGASGGPVSGPEDSAVAAVIAGTINAFEFDDNTATWPHVVNVSGDVYAVAYGGATQAGTLVTLTIYAGGVIGPIIDTLVYDAVGDTPFLFHVSGDIFGIAYSGPNGVGNLVSVDIADGGDIRGLVDGGTLQFTPYLYVDNKPYVVPVAGEIYAIVYDKFQTGVHSLVVETVDIHPTGKPIIAVDEVVDAVGGFGSDPTIVHVSGDVYAIAYRGSLSNEGRVITRTISNFGVIESDNHSDFVFEPDSTHRPIIFGVAGSTFGIVDGDSAGRGRLTTIDIDPSGTIAEGDSLVYADEGYRNQPLAIEGDLYAVAFQDLDLHGSIVTLDIPPAGTSLDLIDTFEFAPVNGETPWPVLVTSAIGTSGSVVGVAHTGPDGDGFLDTLALGEVGAPGFARVPLALIDLINNGQPVEPTGGIALFDTKVTYDPEGVQVLRVGYGEGFQELNPPSTIIDNVTGTTEFFGFASMPDANPPLAHGFVYPRLIGPAAQPYILQWDAAGQPAEPYEYHWTGVGAEVDNAEQITFRRGDLDQNASIHAAGVTILQEAIVGTTPPCDDLAAPGPGCVNPADAAGVKWDDCAVGDRINVYDAIVLAQLVTGTISVLPSTCDDLQGSDPAATVTIATTTMPVSSVVVVPITVSDIADPGPGLGGYEVLVEFDIAVVRVTAVTGGDGPFNLAPTANIDNVAGTVRITFAIGDLQGPTGTLEIAKVRFNSAASPGTTTLDLTVRNLANTVPKEIPSMAVDGMVVVQ